MHADKAANIASFALLAALVLGLGYYKLLFGQYQHFPGYDGGYYQNVAQNVRDGNGLTTQVSLFHKGYRYFPHPTSVYPMWPLALGYVSRWVPIEEARVWLPTLFYFVALGFGYLWAVRRFPKPIFPMAFPGLNAGHVFVLMLGLNFNFFKFTSRPYTEALAFALLLIALWRCEKLWLTPTWRAGAELGIWLALLLLTRSQFLVAPIAAVCVYGWAFLFHQRRREYALMAVASAVTFVLLLLPHLVRINGFLDDPGLFSWLRFDSNRPNSLLSPIDAFVPTDGFWHFLQDRAKGLPVAFGNGRSSYHSHFYTFGYALIAILPFAAIAIFERLRRSRRQALVDWARSSDALPGLFALAFGLGSFLLIHLIHKSVWAEWNFGLRSAIVCVILFFLSLVYLLQSRRLIARLIAITILCSGVYLGINGVRAKVARRTSGASYKSELVQWLNDKALDGDIVVATYDSPQVLSTLTKGVNYHWFYKGTTFEDLRVMVEELGVQYVLLPNRMEDPEFIAQPKRFNSYFRKIGHRSRTQLFKVEPRRMRAQ